MSPIFPKMCFRAFKNLESSQGLYIACQSVSPVTQSCLTLFNSMDWSTPGLHENHQLSEFTQTHVH